MRKKSNKLRLLTAGLAMSLALVACNTLSTSPQLPVPQRILSAAIQPVTYKLQHFAIDSQGQAYGVSGNRLYSIDSMTDELTELYHFSASIVGFHITAGDSFIISTDNNHWSEQAPCQLYESTNMGQSFELIKTIVGGCALWFSISSDDSYLYVGEYGPKKPGVSKNVWRRDGTGHWQVIFRAPLNSEAHIHRVAVDPYTNHLWVTTGDTKKNRGIYLSTDQGKSWQHRVDSQATAVAFLPGRIYWGEDNARFGGVVSTDATGRKLKVEFNAGEKGNYAGSIYQMLALEDGSILAPIMKYADRPNVASLWQGKNGKWQLLMIFESLPGLAVDVSSLAGPDKNGFVLLTGFKLDINRLTRK